MFIAMIVVSNIKTVEGREKNILKKLFVTRADLVIYKISVDRPGYAFSEIR